MKFQIPDLTNTKRNKKRAGDARAAYPAGAAREKTPGGYGAVEEPETEEYSEEDADGYASEADPGSSYREKRPVGKRSMAAGYAIWAGIILVVCILLELFVFNYNHWHAPGGTVLTASNYIQSPLRDLQAGKSDDSQAPKEETGTGDRGALQESFTVSCGPGLEQTEYGTFLITDPEEAYRFRGHSLLCS